MSRRDQILAKIPMIPALPSSATQVLALVEDPDSGIAEIMDAMKHDPALTAEVLRQVKLYLVRCKTLIEP